MKGRTYLWVSFEDGKRVAFQYPSLVDPDWATGLLERFVNVYHGTPHPRPSLYA